MVVWKNGMGTNLIFHRGGVLLSTEPLRKLIETNSPVLTPMLSNAPPARKRKAAALTSGAVASSTELTSVFKARKASRDATKTRAVSATVRLLGISSMKAERC